MIVTTTELEAGDLAKVAALVAEQVAGITSKRGFTREEAAQCSGVGIYKIKQAISEYHLPAKRHGKDIVVLREDLDSWIESWPIA
ncbi:helix-turn-helix domain-containing protein [Microbacterium arborescens]